MFQTTTLHSTSGEIELSCFTEGDRLTWLEFYKFHEEDYPDQHLAWDNDTYLFDTFYPFLHRWKDRICTYEDQLEFKEVWEYFEENEELVDELIEMFDEALKQGWYEPKREG